MKKRGRPKIKIVPMEQQTTQDVEYFFDQQTNSQLSYTLSQAFKPKAISCRQEQKNTIVEFIKECVVSKGEGQFRVLYISGVPGIGKTIATQEVVQEFKSKLSTKKVKFAYINAMGLVKTKDIYKALNRQFMNKADEKKKKNKSILLQLNENLMSSKRIKICVIDEVDFLVTKDQSILYNLFQWCNLPETRLCLIIIANTMDFPERLMPKITSRMGNKRLVFKPYIQKQIQLIVQERLLSSKRFTESAITYACKKLSSYTSDLRKIFNVLRISKDQEKQNKQIDVASIAKNWRKVSQQKGEGWQQQLHDSFKLVLNAIKECGGKAKDVSILEKLRLQHNFSLDEIRMMLQDLYEMQLINLKKVIYHKFFALEVTLRKI